MDLTLLMPLLAISLVVAGLGWVFGPWALVGCGVVLGVLSVVVDWEKLS